MLDLQRRVDVYSVLCRVVPASAHAAFDKGAAYLKIKVHTIPVDRYTRKVDIKRLKRAMYDDIWNYSLEYY